MPDETLQPYQVATMLGVDVGTIRRWCGWHSSLLSESANPPPGGRRRLTAQDVEVLRAVKALRDQGLQTPAINASLAGKVFAVADDTAGPQTAQDSPQRMIAPIQAQLPIETIESVLQPITARLDAIERTQRDRVTVFLVGLSVGLVVAALFFLLIVLLHGLGA